MKRRMPLKALFCLAALCAGALAGCAPEAAEASGETAADAAAGTALTVRGFSAGAADAFLLATERSAVLVDCGEKAFGKELVSYLDAHGIERLDCLVITHFDKDHVGGAAKVLSSLPVERVLQSNCPKESKVYDNYLEALAEAGIEAETVRGALSFTLDGVRYEVDPPAESYAEDESNNSSLILTVTNGNDRLLFMGDAEDARIAAFLNGYSGDCDYLKVPHHGRSGELSEALFEAVRPGIAVITSSEEEPEDDSVVESLERLGAKVYLTRNGDVIAESSGSGVAARYAERDAS